ncbi:hypothetical protein J2T09_003205 [Neorhizobium huautlense]|uniref:Uncharacterized protein n=1 Tax=Neorhizobium huautlense TaxID=67774 RepID=A0ABT9PVE7_9HYPH|nr:hypothetical protein [Neorhizobium huautlense]MDP9838437.1 hypothetical protein [Neorhizobium huautlense]
MLPPVPATSVANAMQANQRQASTQVVELETPVSTKSALDAVRPIAAGTSSSMELLGLSGQMRLAQSLSVFAETLGSLLKLPRREGEALADYSKRLAAAISTLSATERARLQTQLNQIMQGATLRLLTELLKDPAGPAAARLAVQIEIAQYQEHNQGRDLAARHAVSSYRQNNGNDLPALPANSNATPTAMPHGAAAEAADGRADVATVPQHDADSNLSGSAQKENAPATRQAINAGAGATVTASESSAITNSEISKQAADETRGEDGAGHLSPDNETGTDGNTAQADRLPANNRSSEGKAAQAADARPQPIRGEATSQNPVHAAETPSSSRTEQKPASIYDAAALARLAYGENGKPTAAATNQIARAIVDGVQAGWIAELLAGETEARNTRHLVPAQGNTPLAPTGEETNAPEDGTSPGVKQATVFAHAEEDAPIIGPLPQTANPLSTAAAIAAQPDTAFEKALLGMTLLPREVPGHPLIAKDGTPEFDDAQDHEIRRKSPVGDDGQPSRREHQGFHQPSGGEEQQPNGEEQPAEQILSGDEEVHADMPGSMPTTADPKQAPRQHLSDHPAPSAEDLYRRLASLE